MRTLATARSTSRRNISSATTKAIIAAMNIVATAIANADAAIRESEAQAALAAYNAGYGYVRAGAGPRARPLLDRAVTHPAIAAQARELLSFLDR